MDAAVVVFDDDLSVVQQSDIRFDFFNAHVEYAKVERAAVKSSFMNTLWC